MRRPSRLAEGVTRSEEAAVRPGAVQALVATLKGGSVMASVRPDALAPGALGLHHETKLNLIHPMKLNLPDL